MTSGKKKSFYTQATDSLGKFRFDLEDEYGKEMNLLLQTSKNAEKKTNNPIVLDEKKFPPVFFEYDKSIEQIDSIITPFLKKNTIQKEIDEKFKMQAGTVLLDQVTITGTKMSPTRKKVTEEYGKARIIISGKDILAKEKKWSSGLYDILLHNYPGIVTIVRNPDNHFLYAIVNNQPTLVIIDGIPVISYDYPHIPDISPSEVKSFEIIENARGFSRLYCEVHPEIAYFDCARGAPGNGHLISIYTHAGIGLAGAFKPKGLSQTTIPVFATPKEFYAPKYENTQADAWKSLDTRSILHWQPILNTDDLGKAQTSFYNTDSKDEVLVIVEAISDKGEIGYQELNYDIDD
jgi:hypothetical protein